jgi:hypothetical protein
MNRTQSDLEEYEGECEWQEKHLKS